MPPSTWPPPPSVARRFFRRFFGRFFGHFGFSVVRSKKIVLSKNRLAGQPIRLVENHLVENRLVENHLVKNCLVENRPEKTV
jgi:hypothetical protein